MKCNIEAIESAANKVSVSTNRLSSTFASDWNDEVKESYRRYISQCNEKAEKIRSIISKMKSECSKISNANVDELVNDAEATCFAIDGV